MPPTTTAKPTIADVNALVAEALTWSHPWTVEQSERIAALGPFVSAFYARVNEAILSILGEDAPTPQPERVCRRCGAPLTGRARQVYCDSRCFLGRGRAPKPARASRWRRLRFGN